MEWAFFTKKIDEEEVLRIVTPELKEKVLSNF